jgi:pimeloyl-ACP methyl ester carboxylesterase
MFGLRRGWVLGAVSCISNSSGIAAATGCDDDVMTIPDDPPHGNDSAEVTLSLDDGEIYVRQDGPRDAAALLLIHGNASSTRSWDELVPMLTRSHRLIRIDLLGHRRSAKPTDRSYAIPDQARRVGVAMDRLGVERVIVAGHSSGGAATALAERRSDLVAALVLINTGPHMGAYTAPPRAIDPSQWPNVSDEQLRQFTSFLVQPPGLPDPPGAPEPGARHDFPLAHHDDAGQPQLCGGAGVSGSAGAP